MIKRRNIPGLLRRQIWHLTAGKCHICGKGKRDLTPFPCDEDEVAEILDDY